MYTFSTTCKFKKAATFNFSQPISHGTNSLSLFWFFKRILWLDFFGFQFFLFLDPKQKCQVMSHFKLTRLFSSIFIHPIHFHSFNPFWSREIIVFWIGTNKKVGGFHYGKNEIKKSGGWHSHLCGRTRSVTCVPVVIVDTRIQPSRRKQMSYLKQ